MNNSSQVSLNQMSINFNDSKKSIPSKNETIPSRLAAVFTKTSSFGATRTVVSGGSGTVMKLDSLLSSACLVHTIPRVVFFEKAIDGAIQRQDMEYESVNKA